MTQQRPSDDPTAPEPAMELLDGDATAASPAGPSWMMKLARGTLYGVVLLGATALLAVSAVPELANYASFVPDRKGESCAASLGSACTTIDQVSFESAEAASALPTCCPLSEAPDAEGVLATSESGTKSCCSTLSRASLLTAAQAPPACCESAESCSLTGEVAVLDEPIDAGSLLATAEQPADQQSGEDGAELAPDDHEVEE